MFIVLEGSDGSGKTTQAKRLADRLIGVNFDVLHLAFPSTTPAGYAARKAIKVPWKQISDDPHFQAIVVQSLMTADMYGLADQIASTLHDGGIVVADRWRPSGVVYGAADGLNVDWIHTMQNLLPNADLNILLDLNVATVIERISARMLDRDKYENRVFQARVCMGYREMWAKGVSQYQGEWFVVDATKSQNEVHDAIWKLLVAQQIVR